MAPAAADGICRCGAFVSFTPKTVDVKSFLQSLDDKPIFTRQRLEQAQQQLIKAREGKVYVLVDAKGEEVKKKTAGRVAQGKQPYLMYNDLATLADTDPWDLLPHICKGRQRSILTGFRSIDQLKSLARFPVFVMFKQPEPSYFLDDYLFSLLGSMTTNWLASSAREILIECVTRLVTELPEDQKITRIMCFGLGSFIASPASINQHLAVRTIASALEELYLEKGTHPDSPIEILAQNPSYRPADIIFFSMLAPSIEVVTDPKGFSLTNSTLVVAHRPSFPLKQIIADLAADDPSMMPAAILWDDQSSGDGVDLVEIRDGSTAYFANPESRRYRNMMGRFERVMDGWDEFGCDHESCGNGGEDATEDENDEMEVDEQDQQDGGKGQDEAKNQDIPIARDAIKAQDKQEQNDGDKQKQNEEDKQKQNDEDKQENDTIDADHDSDPDSHSHDKCHENHLCMDEVFQVSIGWLANVDLWVRKDWE